MVQPSKKSLAASVDNLFAVVGVGASAGGLEAFRQLLKAIPEASGAAYILVQHIAPLHDSILPEILQRLTRIPVQEITDNLTVLPDHIYIIPSNKILKAKDGVLKLQVRPPKPEKNMPIDIFFKSLAEVHRARAIGIVLSGNGTDGTIGLKCIKHFGGITFAQHPHSANSAGMPLSAIKADTVDHILTPDQMPGKLDKLIMNKFSEGTIKGRGNPTRKIKLAGVTADKLKPIIKKDDFQKIADDMLLSVYMPVGVVVNDHWDVVQFRGSTGTFLQQPSGRPTLNVIDLARHGLSFELRSLLHKARKTKEPVSKAGIPASDGDMYVTIEVIPMLNTIDIHFLVLFINTLLTRKKQGVGVSITNYENDSARVQQLKKELVQCREDMRNITEEQEAVNEKLQIANEELLSGGEELQSLNEELETSKEEIQNRLAELVIVNRELNELNVQYNSERQYSEAIVKTIRHPLLVLTKDLLVQTANDSFYKFFNVNAAEIEGMLLDELAGKQWNIPGLCTRLKNIEREKGFEEYEVSQNFPRIGQKSMLLTASQMYKENSSELLIVLALEDITVKKALDLKEQELSDVLKNERRVLHEFFMQTPACLCIVHGPEHIFELANPLYMELIGNRPVLGKPIREALPELKDQEFALLLDKVYQTGKSFTGKEMPINIDRGQGKMEQVYLNFNCTVLTSSKGETEGIQIFAYDVSEQIIARRKVETSATFFHDMYMNAPAFIATVQGPSYIYELVNPAYQALFVERELFGKPMLEALSELAAQDYKKILDDVYLTGKTFIGKEFPIWLARKEGAGLELRYFNFTNQPIYDDGCITGIFIFGYEVTDEIIGRKILAGITAERISMLEAIPQCAWTASVNGDITYMNKFFYEYTGLIEEETLIWGWTKVVAPTQVEEMYKKYKKLVHAGKDFELELMMKRHVDGSYRWHLLRALAIQNTEGIITSWVGTSTDINDQKLFSEVLEKQVAERTKSLEIAVEELGHSNKNLEQFAYIASHDLQEPLRKIQIFSSMLNDRNLGMTENSKDLIKKIRASTERMTALINDVLNFSKLTSSALIFKAVNLNEVLKDMISDFDLLIADKNALVTFEPMPEIEAVPLQMKQLFYNLISNALKFSLKKRNPVIHISCKMMEDWEVKKNNKLNDDLLYCELICSDNGIGFDQQFAEKIFLIFQRLHERQSYVGTGIGLALCQSIAINHGGEIYAEAVENEGAAFHILLPLSQAKQALNDQP
ncbi:MAG: chemotaxis protein CheB [Ferruginibacter sp.]